MREIKFRGWDKAEKRMLYRTIWDRNWYATPYNDKDGCHCIRGITPDDKPRLILMQFTGLLDSEGVEIYEGDIVRISPLDMQPYVCDVKFKEGAFVDHHGWTIPSKPYLIEVVDNIYEHPELLENK